MKNKINSSPRHAALLFMLLCSAVYFTSYITRINYGAVILSVTRETNISEEILGLVSTTAFFTYGIGQLISGFIGDKVHPRLLIVLGMSVTAVCNIVMSTLSSAVPMMILWGINGFAQAMFWPPMVRLMAENLSERDYNRTCVWVSVASSIATIFIYLLAAACTKFWNWRSIFYISAGTAIVMVVLWEIFTPKKPLKEVGASPDKQSKSLNSSPKRTMGAAVVLMMVPIAVAIILQGILRDGVTTWLPTMISESFTLPESLSILLGMVLPIFSMISYNVSAHIENKIKNELVTSTVFFATATVSTALLALFLKFGHMIFPALKAVLERCHLQKIVDLLIMLPDISPIITVLLLALITGCMHGINLMLISRVPRYFDKYGKISTISGVVNAFTYVGSALATYIVPLIAIKSSWVITVLSWVAIAGMGTFVCIFTIRPWTKFKTDK